MSEVRSGLGCGRRYGWGMKTDHDMGFPLSHQSDHSFDGFLS